LAAIALSLTLFANNSQASSFRTNEAVDCLTQNIYFEARGEPVLGQIAVGYVTLNRLNHPDFPSTICGVVRDGSKHSCQFSWYCDGKSDKLPNTEEVAKIRILATVIITRKLRDPTHGALYFHSVNINPKWKKSEKIIEIGNHVFYRGT